MGILIRKSLEQKQLLLLSLFLFEINYMFFYNRTICIFLFVIKIFVNHSPGCKFFTPFFMVKLVIYPEFSNTLSETLRTYTFLVWSLFKV